MINEHFNCLEATIRAEPLVITASFQRTYTSPDTAYLRGRVTFVDGSQLALFEHLAIQVGQVVVTDYRYHYMSAAKVLIFRYDNAPHHPSLPTAPHHKHTPGGVEAADKPEVADVLSEIVTVIIGAIVGI